MRLRSGQALNRSARFSEWRRRQPSDIDGKPEVASERELKRQPPCLRARRVGRKSASRAYGWMYD